MHSPTGVMCIYAQVHLLCVCSKISTSELLVVYFPSLSRLQSPGSTNRRRMRLLWWRLLADVGGQVAAARHVAPETAEEIMNDFTVTMTRDGKTFTL